MVITEQPQAVLLIGPTGSGKTPLGKHIEEHGLWDRTCHHFDFGENLRAVAHGDRPGFERHEVLFFQNVLEKGTLLEGAMFYLAEKVWRAYRAVANIEENDIVIMNGLPRHAEQVEDAERFADIVQVVHLQCDESTALERLEKDAGGDREDREDDLDPAVVKQKIEDYEKRTKPLAKIFKDKDVPVVDVSVDVETTPEDIMGKLGSVPATLKEATEA